MAGGLGETVNNGGMNMGKLWSNLKVIMKPIILYIKNSNAKDDRL